MDYMRREVFDPLSMNETVAEHVDPLIYHRARFYLRGCDGRIINAPYVDISNKWAGGGFLSTASDLVRFGAAHLGGGFLTPETLRQFWNSQRTRDGQETGYGIGWFVMDRGGQRVVCHTGRATRGSGVWVLLPDDGIVVAILTNLSSERPTETALAIGDLFKSTGGMRPSPKR